MGLVASAVGAALGIAVARGLAALLNSFGVELPGGSTVVTSRSIVVPIVVGAVVAALAAYLPALRASKVPPLAAMRDIAIDTSASSRRRAAIGTVLTVLGAAAILGGADGSAAAPVALGALVVFAGVIVLGPVVGSRFERLVGAPVAALRGMPGVLARDNATRNPKRTAATSSALMIGVALVVLISVLAASARASIDTNINQALSSDWIITPLQVHDGLSPTVAQAVQALPETASVTTFRTATAAIHGATVPVTGIDPATVEQHLDVGVKAGAVRALGAHELGVLQQTAEDHHWHVGDTITMTFPETGVQRFTIAMIYSLRDPLGDYTMSDQAFTANVAHVSDQAVFVIDAPHVPASAAHAAIENVLKHTPSARLYTPAEFEAYVSDRINTLLNLIYVLLFLAVLIALFGVANALALSVVERRRELGLLRAVGMHRRQVRASVRWEALLIALLGTAVGTALGLGFGSALVTSLNRQGIDHVALPGTRLAAITAVAAGAAVLAAALPARRAARLDPLESISA
jgi:putative ABC transport system permease protein